MKDNSKKIAILLVILTVIVLSVSYFTSQKKENKEEPSIMIVNNYSNFYTVNSCLYRVITYISSGNIKDLMLVVSDEYKKKNNLNQDNILNFFPKAYEASTFISKKMYHQYFNNRLDKYYVYGIIEEQSDDGTGSHHDAYFIVYLNYQDKLFSVEPYSGDLFLGGDTNG